MPGRWAEIQVVEAASAEFNTICRRTNTARNGASRPIIQWSRRITPRRVRTLPNRWALANNAGVNGKRAGPARPSQGREARVPFRDHGRLGHGAAGSGANRRGARIVGRGRRSRFERSPWAADCALRRPFRQAMFGGSFGQLHPRRHSQISVSFQGKSENSIAEPNVIPACQLGLDGGGARVVLDLLDHRTHAIGALRRQMRRKAEPLE